MSSTAAGRIGATGRERTLYAAAALSLLAGLLHLWVAPKHFEEWWGYGAFFVVAGAAQILYVPIVVLYLLTLLTRTVGIPLFGPGAGEVEGVSFIDLCATTSEVGIAVALGGRC